MIDELPHGISQEAVLCLLFFLEADVNKSERVMCRSHSNG